jgi:hypothetical protein
MKPIAEHRGIDRAAFESDIVARNEPAVMRGLMGDWPAVRAARSDEGGIAAYLRGMDSGALQSLARYARLSNPSTIAVQSALVSECLPRFGAENRNPLLDDAVAPRIWMGNRVTTAAHFDESSNIACVVAGKRRFTLFPIEAIGDLYIGPIGYAPSGTPISLVDFERPDESRFPRFRRALEAAFTAELEPGDAIYIPPLWWHHVRSLSPFNVLVNYWWESGPPGAGSPFESLVHGLLAIRSLPEPERQAWRTLFDHYVFQTGEDPAAHLDGHFKGVLGPLTPDLAKRIRAFLVRGLQRG